MDSTEYKRISALELKNIAAVLMMINHFCVLFMGKNAETGYDIIIAVTRASFVIFAFLLSEGMLHTKNREKYLLRLFIFAVISEIPFDLFTFGAPIDFTKQNVLLELGIAGSGIYFIDKYNEKYIRILIGIAFIALATVMRADYAYMGVMLVFAFYYLREHRAAMFLTAALVLFLCTLPAGIKEAVIQLSGALAFIPISLYDGTRGKSLPRYFFYCIYPAHLLLLWLISLILNPTFF